MNPKTLQHLLTGVPAVLAGGGAALQAASQGDELPSIALKSALAGAGGALAGRYGPAMLRGPVLDAARGVRDSAMTSINDLRGKGALTAALGVPAAAIGGLGGLALGMGANAGLQAVNAPGFNNNSEEAYMQAISNQGLVDDGSMAYLDQYPEYSTGINPEAYGVSSNTNSARMGVMTMV